MRKGCRFHLGQSIWRKIESIGLSSIYQKNTEMVICLKLFFGLSFLKPSEVDDCFTDDIMQIQPYDIRIHEFCY